MPTARLCRASTATAVAIALTAAGLTIATAPAAALAPDVIDVVAVGTGTGALTSSATPVSIVPMSSVGAVGTPIPLPTAASGSNFPFALSGTATSEGALALSGDGRYLTLAGYATTPGTGSVASTTTTPTAPTVPRVVARIDGNGAVDTSTRLTDAFSGNNVRGAATNDGTGFWVTGAGGSNTPKAGMVQVPLGGSTSTPIVTSINAARVPQTIDGNLYLSTDKTTPAGVSRIGTGLPTSGAQALTSLAGPADPYGFALLNVAGGTGPDTLYVADGTTGGITKYSLIGSTWTAEGTVAAGTVLGGLTGRIKADGVHLYATALNGTKVYSFVDTAGAAAPISGGTLTTLASAPANVAYRGIAFGPAGQPTPRPAPTANLADTVLGAVIGDPDNPTLSFTLADADPTVDPAGLTVTPLTSDEAVAPLAGITITGTGATRTVSISPGGTVGYSTITLRITDPGSGATGTTSFLYGASAAAPDATSHWLAGASDASTAFDAGDGYVLVGDDTSNALRLYRGDRSGLPVTSWDFSAALGLSTKNSDSIDIEAAARLGDTIYWTGSMGNSSDDGALRPSRAIMFATRVTGTGASTQLTFAGAYRNLRDDLINWDIANGNTYRLTDSAAAGHSPKTIDGFNVEGMEFAADGSGTAYIGFRAPLETVTTRNLALVVAVTNLTDLITGTATTASIGTPMLWDLGGRSVREIRRNAHGQYLIIAGSYAGGGKFALYSWDGNPTDQPVAALTLPAPLGSWESIVAVPDPLISGATVQLIEDDGSVDFYGDGNTTEAKALPLGLRKSRIDTFTLTLPGQAVTFTSTPSSASYGGTYTPAATGGPSGNPVVVSIAPATANVCSMSGGTVRFTGVGTCTIDADQAAGRGYDPGHAEQSFTVTPAILTVTADDKTAVLNGAAPPLTATITGFVNGDTAASATAGQPACFVPTGATGTVGAAAITCTGGTLTATNYVFRFAPGALHVMYASTGRCNGDAGHQILQPVNADGSSVFKLGSTVPAKFRVCDANGTSVGPTTAAPPVVSSFALVATRSGTASNTVNEAVASTTPDTAFRWDASAQQWIFNISTKSLTANTTYTYQVTLADGSAITFVFGLR
ncbi:PxKF domain-containing protein [Dactylosporangium sp. NPDC048998]|uniref:PxKF domain-containing protein n=1 Tax=Dactylosporangium sp. NPDC048998 TaxID=3363976 RepID=UPI003723240A